MARTAACHTCDLLLQMTSLSTGERAGCPRCGTVIARSAADGVDRGLAFAVAALVLLGFSVSFPFLGFSAGGQQRAMTLLQSGTALLETGEQVLGWTVLALVILVPLAIVCVLITLLTCVRLEKNFDWLPRLGRLVHELDHWNMVEVFFIGVLVSLTKIASMASIELGIAFWAFSGFAFCLLAAMNAFDRHALWRRIEALRS